jgi:hypothetical protein
MKFIAFTLSVAMATTLIDYAEHTIIKPKQHIRTKPIANLVVRQPAIKNGLKASNTEYQREASEVVTLLDKITETSKGTAMVKNLKKDKRKTLFSHDDEMVTVKTDDETDTKEPKKNTDDDVDDTEKKSNHDDEEIQKGNSDDEVEKTKYQQDDSDLDESKRSDPNGSKDFEKLKKDRTKYLQEETEGKKVLYDNNNAPKPSPSKVRVRRARVRRDPMIIGKRAEFNPNREVPPESREPLRTEGDDKNTLPKSTTFIISITFLGVFLTILVLLGYYQRNQMESKDEETPNNE